MGGVLLSAMHDTDISARPNSIPAPLVHRAPVLEMVISSGIRFSSFDETLLPSYGFT